MLFNKKIYIGDRCISLDSPTFIIAEAGVNHNGNIEIAKELIDIAVKADADAVKFQTFDTDSLVLQDIKKAPYQKKTSDLDESQFDMLKKLEISNEQNIELREYCLDKNIVFLTTPFDEVSLEEVLKLDLPAYKVSSTDVTNLPFLKRIAQKRKPIFLSTGMSYLSEVELALNEIYKWNKDVVLLHCTSNYPIKNNEVNLSVINTYKDNFDMLIGYSDHSVGLGAAPFAIPMGAKIVEKHFTLDKKSNGPDHASSLSPEELIEFVKTVRTVDTYIGNGIKTPTLSENNTRKSLQKFLVASKDIKNGEYFSEDNIVAKRTGGVGISPIYYRHLIRKKSDRDYTKNEVIVIE